MTLAETQALLHGALTGAAPAAAGALEACLRDTPGLAALEGVALYGRMYRTRLTEALREVFPTLAVALGEARFAAMAADYLERHPSEHHDVGRVGRRLAGFLRRHPASERSDLADLAALEWARHRVFFAPSARAVGRESLAAMGPEALAAARPRLAPALRLLRLRHDVLPAWRVLSRGDDAEPAVSAVTTVAVWRRGFEVFHGGLGEEEAAALRVVRSGASLGEALAAFAALPEPAEAARRALAGWIGEGWLTALTAR